MKAGEVKGTQAEKECGEQLLKLKLGDKLGDH